MKTRKTLFTWLLTAVVFSLFSLWGTASWADNTYKLVKSLDELSDGCIVLIVNTENSRAMGVEASNGYNRLGVEVTITDEVITAPTINTGTGTDYPYEIKLLQNDDKTAWALQVVADPTKYLQAGGGKSNNRLQEVTTKNDKWEISSMNSTTGTVTIKDNSKTGRIILQYNGTSNNQFAYYASANQKEVQIYLKQGNGGNTSSLGKPAFTADSLTIDPTDGIMLTWGLVEGADSYTVEYWEKGDEENKTVITGKTAEDAEMCMIPGSFVNLQEYCVRVWAKKGTDSAANAAVTVYAGKGVIVDPTSLTLTGYKGVDVTETFTLTMINIPSPSISLDFTSTDEGFTVTPSTIETATPNPVTVTVTYNGNGSEPATLTISDLGSTPFTPVTIPVSVTVTDKPQANTYTKVTTAADLNDGDRVIIVSGTNVFNGNIASNWGGYFSIASSFKGEDIEIIPASTQDETNKPHEFIVAKNGNYFTLEESTGKGFLFSSTNSSRDAIAYNTTGQDIRFCKDFNPSASKDSGIAIGSRYLRLNTNNNYGFRFYLNKLTGNDVCLYKRPGNTTPPPPVGDDPYITAQASVTYSLNVGESLEGKRLTFDTGRIGNETITVALKNGEESKLTATIDETAEQFTVVLNSKAAFTAAETYTDTLILTSGTAVAKTEVKVIVNKLRTPKVTIEPNGGFFINNAKVTLNVEGNYDIRYVMSDFFNDIVPGVVGQDTLAYTKGTPVELTKKYIYALAYDPTNEREAVADSVVRSNEFTVITFKPAPLPLVFTGAQKGEYKGDSVYFNAATNKEPYSNNANIRITEGGKLIAAFKDRPKKVSYYLKGNTGGSMPEGAKFDVMVSAGAEHWTIVKTHTSADIPTTDVELYEVNLSDTVRYIQWIYSEYKSGLVVGLGNITVSPVEATLALAPKSTTKEAILYSQTNETEVTLNGTYLDGDVTVSLQGTNSAFALKEETSPVTVSPTGKAITDRKFTVVYTARNANGKDTAMLIAKYSETLSDTAYVYAESKVCPVPVIGNDQVNVNVGNIDVTPVAVTGYTDFQFAYTNTQANLATATVYDSAVHFILTTPDATSTTYYYKARRVCVANTATGSDPDNGIYSVWVDTLKVESADAAAPSIDFDGDIVVDVTNLEKNFTIKFKVTNFGLGESATETNKGYIHTVFKQGESTVFEDTMSELEHQHWFASGTYTVYANLLNLDKTPLTENTASTNTKEFTIKLQDCAKPTITVNPSANAVNSDDATAYYDTITVALACATPTTGASVWYKLNDASEFTEYTTALKLGANTTLVAESRATGYDKADTTATYSFKVWTPEITPVPAAGQVYSDSVWFKLSCKTSGAKIYYTTDKTTPTAESTLFSDSVKLTANTTIKAIAIKETTNSAVLTQEYKVKFHGLIWGPETFAKATFSSQFDPLTTDTTDIPGWSGENIYGSNNRDNGAVRVGASKLGWIQTPAIDLSGNNGKYYLAFDAAAWNNDSEKIAIDVIANDETIHITDLKKGLNNLTEYVFAFTNGKAGSTIKWTALQPSNNRFYLDNVRIYSSLPEGMSLAKLNDIADVTLPAYSAGQTTSAKVKVTGSALENDLDVTVSKNVFTVAPAKLSATKVNAANGDTITVSYTGSALKDTAVVTVNGGSAALTKTFKVYVTKNVPTVGEITFTPGTGTYADSVWVKMTCATEGASIRYTLDGSEPTETSTLFADSIKLTATKTVKARGFKADMLEGPVASATYTIKAASEIVTVEGEEFFTETFDNACKTGTMASPSGNVDLTNADNQGWSWYKADNATNSAAGAIKFGKGAALATPAVNVSYNEGLFYVTFKAQSWAKDDSTFTLVCVSKTHRDTVVVENLPKNASGGSADNWGEFAYKFIHGTDSTYLIFAANSGKRLFLDDVKMYQANRPVMASLTVASSATIRFAEGEAATTTLTVKGKNLEQNVTVAAGKATFKVTPDTLAKADVMGENGVSVTVTYTGENDKDTADIVFTYGNDLTKTTTIYVSKLASYETLEDLLALYDIENYTVFSNEPVSVTGKFVVTHKDDYNNRIWLQDEYFSDEEGASILVYKAGNFGYADLAVGDVIEGLKGTPSAYKRLFEITPTDTLKAIAHNHGFYIPTVELVDLEQDDLGLYNLNALVTVEDVMFEDAGGKFETTNNGGAKSYVLKNEAGEQLTFRTDFRNANYIDSVIPAGKVKVTGIVSWYDNDIQIAARSMSDIVVTGEAKPKLEAKPVISPEEGTYADSVWVEITCDSTKADIYYTLDGSNPTVNSTKYTVRFKLTETKTVKAIAAMEGYLPSDVASKTYTIKAASEIVTPVGDVVFEEHFSKCNLAWGNGDDKSDDLDRYTDMTGWTGSKVYPVKGAVKMGSGSALGYITSKAIDLSNNEGVFYVSFKASAWKGDATSIYLIAGTDTVSVEDLNNAVMNGSVSDEAAAAAWTDYAFKFENGIDTTKLTFTAKQSSNNRFYIDDVKVYQELPADMPLFIGLPAEVAMSYVKGQSVSEQVTVKGKNLAEDVAITVAGEGFTVAPATLAKADVMGENGANFTVTYNGAAEESATATVTVKSGSLTKTIAVTATALPGVATLEELYELYDDVADGTIGANEVYVVTGDLVVTHKDSYSNRVYLQDAVMNDEEGASILVYKAGDYGYADLQVGDVISGLKGTLTVYKNLFEVNPKEKMVAKSHGHDVYVDEVNMWWLTDEDMGIYYQSALVTLKNVNILCEEDDVFTSKATYKVTDGTDTIDFYVTFNDADYLGDNVNDSAMNLTGIITWFEDAVQITPRSWADMEIIRTQGPDVANEEDTRVDFAVYPNPAAGKFYVKAADALVEIYNASGVRIAAKQVNGRAEFNLGASGVYFVKVGNSVKRVVIR